MGVLVNPFIYGSGANLVTTLYTGTSAARDIITGQNQSSDGALNIIKARDEVGSHLYFDTDRGANKYLQSNNSLAEQTVTQHLTSFNSNGFSLGTNNSINLSGIDYVAWSFLQKAGFMDIVEWDGDGVAGKQVTIDLGGADFGSAIVKRLDAVADWAVQHKDLTDAQHYLALNTTAAENTNTTYWDSTAATSTVLTLGDNATVNASGGSYIAYLFAHNPSQGIACGSFTTDGSGNATVTGLGFRPKWLLVKNITTGGTSWLMLDTERGWNNTAAKTLFAESSNVESSNASFSEATSDGFTVTSFTPSNDYIYMAVA